MKPKIHNINHIAIVVPNIERSLKFWQDILGIKLDYTESVPSMEIELAWLPVGKTRIELIEPPQNENNEYSRFLQENGPGFHHMCIEVDDIDAMVETLKANQVRLKDRGVIELPGRKLIFLEPESCDGVIVELYELIKY